MTHCINCGALASMKIPPDDNRHRLVCDACGHVYYENPKLVVGILPYYENQILLCKRAIDPRKGKWTVPAGFMECDETLREGALREAQEEAHIDINIKQLYVIYSVPKVNQVHMIYLGELRQKQWKNGIETAAIDLFTFDHIPWDEIAFASISFSLEKYIQDFKTQGFSLYDV